MELGMTTPIEDHTIRTAIAAELARVGWSNYRLARQSGVSAVVIGRFLSRQRDIKASTAARLMAALGLKIERNRDDRQTDC